MKKAIAMAMMKPMLASVLTSISRSHGMPASAFWPASETFQLGRIIV